MFGKLESGVGKGWGKGGVFSRFTDGELGTALSDSLRNLFTCGRATNNYRAKNDFPFRQPYNINRAVRGNTGLSY